MVGDGLGGLYGALVLATAITVTSGLGASTTVASVVLGQVKCPLFLDQLGPLGLTADPNDFRGGVAAVLPLAGAFFML